MSLFNLFKRTANQPILIPSSFEQQAEKAGLLVTSELNNALDDCKAKVARISKDCRSKNRKFRDIEFDLENDRYRCLNGLGGSGENYSPADVQRVSEIFDSPEFFIDGAGAGDLEQGQLGDCWFVAALATMSTQEGLVEKFCVARDEIVGVYGFIFFRDAHWVTVITDDLLFTTIPKFEELPDDTKRLYHQDKREYNSSARKGSKALYFSRSSTEGETWVPLLEKAYAKLHGSYAALSGGRTSEAIEDLTGGVSTTIASADILDIDVFWSSELLKANEDRLCGVSFRPLSGVTEETRVDGLFGGHAYSVIRAVAVNGKRFVVVRNPWGNSEWTGPWSDGSKEWTKEWLDVLPELGHSFGDDGMFVMEYSDFLECWQTIDRTILFDSSWAMSSQWVHVQARPLPSAWTYGDVSFTITIPAATEAIIVLSQLDRRFWSDISGRCYWSFDFLLFRKGKKELVTESSSALPYSRSVNAEVHLEAGEYVVHVRLDRYRYREEDYMDKMSDWDPSVLSRVLSERAKAQSLAVNFKADSQEQYLPIPLDTLAGEDLSQLEKKALALSIEKKKAEEAEQRRIVAEEDVKIRLAEVEAARKIAAAAQEEVDRINGVIQGTDKKEREEVVGLELIDQAAVPDPLIDATARGLQIPPVQNGQDLFDVSEDVSVFLGLRVYTNKVSPALIAGQLRHEIEKKHDNLQAQYVSANAPPIPATVASSGFPSPGSIPPSPLPV